MDASIVFVKDNKPSISNSTKQVLLDDVFLTSNPSVVQCCFILIENAHRDLDQLVIITIRIPPQ